MARSTALCGVAVAQVIQHHRATPDLANGVADALRGDVRRGPMHGFEHRRKTSFGIDVGRGQFRAVFALRRAVA